MTMYILTDILIYVPVCICTWLPWTDASIASNIACKYKYKICIVSNILTVIRLCACLHRFLLTGPDWLSPGPLPRPHPSSQGIRIRVLPFWIIFSFFSHSSVRTSEIGIMWIFRFVTAASYHMGHFYAAMSNQSLFSNKTIWLLVLAEAWYFTK